MIWDDARDVTEILSPLEQAAEKSSEIFDRLAPDDKRALMVRLLAIGALNEGDLGYVDQVAEQARDTVQEFLANVAASRARLDS